MKFSTAVSAAAMAAVAGAAWGQGVTEADLANDAANTSQVVTNGMGRHLQRFSPLDAINKRTWRR